MKKAVILFNLGGPDKLESVEPFLFNLFNDPAIISIPLIFRYPLAKIISKRRAPVAKKIYKEIGGSSPILKLTMDQSIELEKSLNSMQNKIDYKTFIAMRCWHPRAEQTDTEVITVMLTDFLKSENLINCIHKTLEKLEGSFALGVIFKDFNNVVVGARRAGLRLDASMRRFLSACGVQPD